MNEYPTPAAIIAALNGDLENAVVASTPGGIERQEAAGQKALVQSTNMPLELHPSKEAFESVGFVFGDKIDDVFMSAHLPEGWTREATEHAMHSTILDAKGRERVSVFYKAAFYDRCANAGLKPRYMADHLAYTIDHPRDDKTDAMIITDAGDIIKQFDVIDFSELEGEARWKKQDEMEGEARKWLSKNFPDFADPTAYWD